MSPHTRLMTPQRCSGRVAALAAHEQCLFSFYGAFETVCPLGPTQRMHVAQGRCCNAAEPGSAAGRGRGFDAGWSRGAGEQRALFISTHAGGAQGAVPWRWRRGVGRRPRQPRGVRRRGSVVHSARALEGWSVVAATSSRERTPRTSPSTHQHPPGASHAGWPARRKPSWHPWRLVTHRFAVPLGQGARRVGPPTTPVRASESQQSASRARGRRDATWPGIDRAWL